MSEQIKTNVIAVRKTPVCPVCMSAKYITVNWMYIEDEDGSVKFRAIIDCEDCFVQSVAESKYI